MVQPSWIVVDGHVLPDVNNLETLTFWCYIFKNRLIVYGHVVL